MQELEVMVAEVVKLLEKEHLSNIKAEFLNTPKDNLVKWHSILGRTIRNEFKLWEIEWTPDIRDGIDYSQNHPDQISLLIMTKVWEQLTAEKHNV